MRGKRKSIKEPVFRYQQKTSGVISMFRLACRKFSDLLSVRAGKIPPLYLKAILVLLLGCQFLVCVLLLSGKIKYPFFSYRMPQTAVTVQVGQNDSLWRKSNPATDLARIKSFRRYLDGLTKIKRDSVLRGHPGLLDSMDIIEHLLEQ